MIMMNEGKDEWKEGRRSVIHIVSSKGYLFPWLGLVYYLPLVHSHIYVLNHLQYRDNSGNQAVHLQKIKKKVVEKILTRNVFHM